MREVRSAVMVSPLGLVAILLLASGCGPKPGASAPMPNPPAGTNLTVAAAGGAAATPDKPAVTAVPEGLSGTLTVGVPCGLSMAYKQVRTVFLAHNPGVRFVDHVKNIGPMTKEVRDGKASLDVFLSLGEREIKTITDAGMVAGKPVPFLRQAMQLMVRKGNPLGIKSLADLAKSEVKTVAVCDPGLTLGNAGEQALRKAGVWDKLMGEGKVVRPGQPMQAKEMVIGGKADATFIYAACSSKNWKEGDPERSVVGKADVVMTVPEADYGGMEAVAAVLNTAADAKLAQAFVAFLLTPEAQEAIGKWGYGRIDQPLGAK